MNVRKTDYFIADLRVSIPVVSDQRRLGSGADRYLDAVEATCRLLSHHPNLGPRGAFRHSRLHGWRFFLALRPFSSHILFYEVVGDEIVMRRTMRGQRDLPRRLVEIPGAE